ncbi:hypothetical protein EC971742_1415, partial [Escherichia coli 97.1742]
IALSGGRGGRVIGREELIQGELPFSVSVLIYDLRCPTVL